MASHSKTSDQTSMFGGKDPNSAPDQAINKEIRRIFSVKSTEKIRFFAFQDMISCKRGGPLREKPDRGKLTRKARRESLKRKA